MFPVFPVTVMLNVQGLPEYRVVDETRRPDADGQRHDALPVQPGDVLQSYEIVRPLGDGGFASVWLVRHQILRSRHALKLLDPRWLRDEAMRDRFLAEGRILAQLQHPNLVAVTDVIVAFPERVGLVMAFIEGPSLADRLDQGPLPREQALAIVIGVLDGVHHAHEHGVVHRDLKPENILLDAEGRPHVGDFGVSLRLGARPRDRQHTATGAVVGTLGYLAPEQAGAFGGEITVAADVWGLGAVLKCRLHSNNISLDTPSRWRISGPTAWITSRAFSLTSS